VAHLIDAYRTDTGEKVRVPADWIGHPVLGVPFSETPRGTKAAPAAPTKTPVAGDKEKI